MPNGRNSARFHNQREIFRYRHNNNRRARAAVTCCLDEALFTSFENDERHRWGRAPFSDAIKLDTHPSCLAVNRRNGPPDSSGQREIQTVETENSSKMLLHIQRDLLLEGGWTVSNSNLNSQSQFSLR